MELSKYLIFLILSFFIPLFASCNGSVSSISNPLPSCQSIHPGDRLEKLINSPLQLNLLVSRNNAGEGHIAVILPSANDNASVFWVKTNHEEKWEIAAKQTVAKVEERLLDFSPMSKVKTKKMIIFIELPTSYFQKQLSIQPVLEETESRWGQLQPYPTRFSAHGFLHPLSGVEQGLSGQVLPQNLQTKVNQLESGSIYVPSIYFSEIELLKSAKVNPQLCPSTQ